MEKFGVTPDKVVDVQALAGDSTDNVPGVPGIGVKTAAQLINEYGDLETLLARAGEIKQPKRREVAAAECRAGAHLASKLVHAQGRRADAGRARGLRQAEARSQRAAALAGAAGLQEPARRASPSELGEATSPWRRPRPPRRRRSPRRGQSKPAPAARAKANQPFTAADYELIQDEKALDEWIAEATKAGVVAFDCETDALDSNNAGLVGVSLALLEGPWGNVNSSRRRAAYLPIGHRAPGGEAPGRARSRRRRRQGRRRQAAARPAPAQEGDRQAEAAAGRPGGAEGRPEHQVRHVRARAATASRSARSTTPCCCPSCSTAASTATAWTSWPSAISARRPSSSPTSRARGAKQVSFDQVPIDKARDYAAEDADVTLQLWAQLQAAARRRAHGRRMYETIERPLIPVLLGMETAGIKVDATALQDAVSAEFEKRHGRARAARSTRSPAATFNVGSPKQLGEILFDEQKLPGGKRNKTGAWATDAGVLEDLAAQGHALPVKILEHRQLAKLKGTYTDALVRELDAKTGRVHTSYQHDRRGDRPARLDRSQPAEHPGAHRGGPQDPRGLHRREGPQAAVAPTTRRSSCGCWRTWPTSPRSRRPSRAATTSTPSPPRDVRRAGQGHGPAGAPPRQGDQLRHHLRHLGASASPTSSASASPRRATTSPSTSSAIPASATTWRRPRTTRASTAT